ncbi:hypothetical protein BO86DRAFT_375372 [Aspergillus japonicus CBS 114.51]|uniref:Uncharacterized protein n=1 Tax=Aspergillus japonicus CBS 114.51 TaxID=1448312 RepID=A0A8T8XEY7_ASPJA|nr:hypothetical protein BO86DRAFT_375372 [Aspergillus japonicus CBS 114.51]RAH86621.1 hypothetical protein BO86DRAFT_375372 [Aspergillus japonicus CBS 114.51]
MTISRAEETELRWLRLRLPDAHSIFESLEKSPPTSTEQTGSMKHCFQSSGIWLCIPRMTSSQRMIKSNFQLVVCVPQTSASLALITQRITKEEFDVFGNVPGPPSNSERIGHLDINYPPYANYYALSTEEIVTLVERPMRGPAADIAVGDQIASAETENEGDGGEQITGSGQIASAEMGHEGEESSHIEEEEGQTPEERGQGRSKLEVMKRLVKDWVAVLLDSSPLGLGPSGILIALSSSLRAYVAFSVLPLPLSLFCFL